jgi:hypothetical protein
MVSNLQRRYQVGEKRGFPDPLPGKKSPERNEERKQAAATGHFPRDVWRGEGRGFWLLE